MMERWCRVREGLGKRGNKTEEKEEGGREKEGDEEERSRE